MSLRGAKRRSNPVCYLVAHRPRARRDRHGFLAALAMTEGDGVIARSKATKQSGVLPGGSPPSRATRLLRPACGGARNDNGMRWDCCGPVAGLENLAMTEAGKRAGIAPRPFQCKPCYRRSSATGSFGPAGLRMTRSRRRDEISTCLPCRRRLASPELSSHPPGSRTRAPRS